MFLKAIIDETTPLSPKEERFASILQFVADDFDRGFFYLYKDWLLRMRTGQSTKEFHPELSRLVYLSKREIAANNGPLITDEGIGAVPIHRPTDELVYSTSDATCRGALEQQGLNATTALLTLAAAGVDIALPNVSFSRASADDVAEIRRKLENKRVIYLGAVSDMADQAFGRLSSGDFRDIYDWAKNEATLKILPKARLLQSQLRKLDRSLLERAGLQLWQEGIPAIGKALVNSGKEAAIRAVAEETIRVFAGTLAKRIEERKIPQAAYTLKLSAELSKL
ncbi:MAG: hypothetical protein ACRD9S_07515 [Pyrinomonadaceae bacterium]